LNFHNYSNNDIIYRENNYVESFHHKLNYFLRTIHPRISILVEKLTDFSIEYYRNYVNKLFAQNASDKAQLNIFEISLIF
jgi:hypothetical protein